MASMFMKEIQNIITALFIIPFPKVGMDWSGGGEENVMRRHIFPGERMSDRICP